jgi:hypothetical protein
VPELLQAVAVFFRLTDGSFHGGDEAGDLSSGAVVGCAVDEAFHGGVFSHGAGEEDERYIRALLADEEESGEAVKRGERLI